MRPTCLCNATSHRSFPDSARAMRTNSMRPDQAVKFASRSLIIFSQRWRKISIFILSHRLNRAFSHSWPSSQILIKRTAKVIFRVHYSQVSSEMSISNGISRFRSHLKAFEAIYFILTVKNHHISLKTHICDYIYLHESTKLHLFTPAWNRKIRRNRVAEKKNKTKQKRVDLLLA